MNSENKVNLYDYFCYRKYLSTCFEKQGLKLSAAKAIKIHSTYISRILKGDANLSLEQAELMNSYLKHNPEESHYFLLLVQHERAGTTTLKEYFKNQILQTLSERQIIINRIGETRKLPDEFGLKFYSKWYYAAVHILISIPSYQTVEAISEYIKLPYETVSEVLTFLEACHLAIRDGDRYKIGPNHIHSGKGSQLSKLHHQNWRHQAILSLENNSDSNLHYSGIFSLTPSIAAEIKENIISCLQKNTELVLASKEEVVYVYNFDFFELKRT